MRNIFKSPMLIVSLLFFNSIALGQTAMNDSIIRTPIFETYLKKVKDVHKIEIKQIEFSPLQKTGLHFHSMPVLGYINEGEILFKINGQKSQVLKQGDIFFEPANEEIVHFDNLSSSKDAIFTAIYLLGKNDKQLITHLEG